MNISIICFSREGEKTAQRLKAALRSSNQVELACKSRSTSFTIEESLAEWTEERFASKDGLIFVSACGIAVRAIAPYLDNKEEDPAVVVLDEKGDHVISLLSGHLGGANSLTLEVAKGIGAVPVITTATDINEKLAPDLFAKRNDCVIDNIKAAGRIAAAILDGETVHIFTDLEFAQNPPDYIMVHPLALLEEGMKEKILRIVISPESRCRTEDPDTLWLIPRICYLGIGCRRGITEERVRVAVNRTLEEAGLDIRSIRRAASIDLKSKEEGLLRYFRQEGMDYAFFTDEELLQAEGAFTKSDFVRSITGVESVCERSAIAATRFAGILVKSKTVHDKVTVAIAEKKGKLSFE